MKSRNRINTCLSPKSFQGDLSASIQAGGHPRHQKTGSRMPRALGYEVAKREVRHLHDRLMSLADWSLEYRLRAASQRWAGCSYPS